MHPDDPAVGPDVALLDVVAVVVSGQRGRQPSGGVRPVGGVGDFDDEAAEELVLLESGEGAEGDVGLDEAPVEADDCGPPGRLVEC